MELFRKDPEAARIFLRKDGTPLQPGDRLVQKDLARTLEAIAKNGPDAFYKGKIPQAVEAAAKKGGGVFRAPGTIATAPDLGLPAGTDIGLVAGGKIVFGPGLKIANGARLRARVGF